MPSDRRQSRRSSLSVDAVRSVFEVHADPDTGFISLAKLEELIERSRGKRLVRSLRRCASLPHTLCSMHFGLSSKEE
jgi:hypothetical protein